MRSGLGRPWQRDTNSEFALAVSGTLLKFGGLRL